MSAPSLVKAIGAAWHLPGGTSVAFLRPVVGPLGLSRRHRVLPDGRSAELTPQRAVEAASPVGSFSSLQTFEVKWRRRSASVRSCPHGIKFVVGQRETVR